jgi:hypothetical protein
MTQFLMLTRMRGRGTGPKRSARWRGAAFTGTPFARTFLKPRVYEVGVCEQAAPANVS